MDLEQQINGAIAQGLNQVAEIALTDIREHVQVQSGRLRESYAIVQRATPDSLEVTVASPVDYRINHYPLAAPNARPDRNRSLQGNPLVNPAAEDSSKLEAVIEAQITQALNQL
ncbi:MAG: hypothetical protein KME15_20005 [Drouetiella hepatica Uher 2000/2452]|jgi:hypothetical protein|uniref:Uncharacterized protein n=1 Tax=Drouetiella hepatica Uher 2000/2452 TaxID=904376 RepID=A0A951UNP0_9CYAN|nr:hypothetical protein [Drouetiella hepatica Uher 2000/2452]